jgi:hypothetical protein
VSLSSPPRVAQPDSADSAVIARRAPQPSLVPRSSPRSTLCTCSTWGYGILF